jgi:D-psicose/D-tagatose/L-ribulose 3-epimerase
MRFGCCVPPDQVAILAQAGFDFCELPTSAVRPLDDDAAALPSLRALAALPLPIESFNVLVPASLPLLGPNVDWAALRNYLRRAFSRMVQLGAPVVVLGSGGARRIPEGMPRDQALDELAESLALAADEATQAGITLVLEHLNQAECNVFTSLAECQTFINERGLKGLALLADLYHLEVEHESFAAVSAAAPLLRHVHVADGGRRAPGMGGYDYAGFMATLHAIGYDQRISAECGWDNLAEQAPAALEFMRRSWLAASG